MDKLPVEGQGGIAMYELKKSEKASEINSVKPMISF